MLRLQPESSLDSPSGDDEASRFASFFQPECCSIYLDILAPSEVDVARHYRFGLAARDAALSSEQFGYLNVALRAAQIAFLRQAGSGSLLSEEDHDLRAALSRSEECFHALWKMDTRQVAQALYEAVIEGDLVYLPPADELRACVRAIEGDRQKRAPPNPPRMQSDGPLPSEVLYGRAPPRAAPVRVTEFIKGQSADVKALIAKSPGLEAHLKALNDADWKIGYGELGGGSYAKRERSTIILDNQLEKRPIELVQTLSHEVGHAAYPYKENFSSKGAYLKGVMADEGAATMSNIVTQREIIANGGPNIGVAGKNYATYNAAYDAFLTDGDAEACRNTIGAAIGNEITSTTGQTYNEYYGGWYDKYMVPPK